MRVDQAGLLNRSLLEGEALAQTQLARLTRPVVQPRQAPLPQDSGRFLSGVSLKLQAKLAQAQADGVQGRGLFSGLTRLSGSLKTQLQTLRDHAALAPVLADVKQKLSTQASDASAFNTTLRRAFGDRFDAAKAETLRRQVQAGDFSWMPKIQVVSQKHLRDLTGVQGAGVGLGAYAAGSDTIYLSRELLKDSAHASRTLLEEVGHGIDARINTQDAAGDEGEVFGRLVSGETLDAQALQALKSDNDRGAVRIGGKVQEVEYGFLKKAVKKVGKAVKKGVSKIGKAVVNGAANVVKSAVKVTTGLATFDFDRVKQGFSQGTRAITTTTKEIHEAAKDVAKETHEAAKELVKKALTSQLLGYVLMVARFIPIPIVQLVVRVVELARAAYMVYQGVKNKSLGMALGGLASLASGAAKYGSSFGASATTVRTLQTVSNVAGKVSMAYKAVAEKDIGAAVGLLTGTKMAQGALAGNATLANVADYASKGLAVAQSVRKGDTLEALGGALGLAGAAIGGKTAQTLANVRLGVDVVRAVRLVDKGDIGMADQLIAALPLAQQASKAADAVIDARRAAERLPEELAQAQRLAGSVREQASTSEPVLQTQPLTEEAPITVTDLTPPGPRTLSVQRGQTLESIAKAAYPTDYRAGLALLALANNIQFDARTGTPLLHAGQSLKVLDLDSAPQDVQAELRKAGGKLISGNTQGLQPKEPPAPPVRPSVQPNPPAQTEPMEQTTRLFGPLKPVPLRNDSAAASGTFADVLFNAVGIGTAWGADDVPLVLRRDQASGKAQRPSVTIAENISLPLPGSSPIFMTVASKPSDAPPAFGNGPNEGPGVIVRASTEEGEIVKRFLPSMLRTSQAIANVPKGLTKIDGSPVTLSYDEATGTPYWNLGEGVLRAITPQYEKQLSLKQAALADPNNPFAKIPRLDNVLNDVVTAKPLEIAGEFIKEKAGEFKKGYNELRVRAEADAAQRGGALGNSQKNLIQAVDFLAGGAMWAADVVGAFSALTYHGGQLLNPLEWALNSKDNVSRANTTALVLDTVGDVLSPTEYVLRPEETRAKRDALVDAFLQPYREGTTAQGVGRAFLEIASVVAPLVRLVAAAKTAAATRTAEVATAGTNALYSFDDMARAMGVQDVAKAADDAVDVARLPLIEERARAAAGSGAGSVAASTAESYVGTANVASGAAGKVADAARAAQALEFSPFGRALRSDAMVVYNQNLVLRNGETWAPLGCGPFAGAMALKTLGKHAEAADLLTLADAASTNGMSPVELASMLRWAGVNAVYKRGLSAQDLADATAKGYPALAIVSQRNPAQSHYVVVDYATVKTEANVLNYMSLKNEAPVSVFAVRDSAAFGKYGGKYFEKLSSFERRFLEEDGGHAVVIEGMLSDAAVAQEKFGDAMTIIRANKAGFSNVVNGARPLDAPTGTVRSSEVPSVIKGSSEPSPFDQAGRMPGNNATDVMYQVDGPYKAEDACGALACAMVLKSMGKDGAAQDLRVIADLVSPNGLPLKAYVSLLRQGGLDAVYKKGLSMEELAAATKKAPVMVGVWSTPKHAHGIVVDYVTTRPNNIPHWFTGKYEEVPVFAIRDPGNPPYFQKVSEFDKWFHIQGREAIVVEGTLSDAAIAAETTRVRLAQHLAEAERRLDDAAAAAEKIRDLTDAMKLKGAPLGPVAGTVGETPAGAANVVKGGADRGSDLPGKTERVEPPLFDTSTDITDFNPLGLLPRHDSRAVFGLDGAQAACTSVACAMALDTMGKRAAAADMLTLADAVAPEGMYFEQLGSWLRQAGVDATYRRDVSLQDIAKATETGNPALVTVWQGDATSVHATVVDAVTTRHGIPVVAIRDPWGYQYFERASDFEGRLVAGRGEAFFINGLLSGNSSEAGLAIGVGEDGLGPLTKPTNWGLVPESWGRGQESIADSGASITKASAQRVIAKTEPVDAADIEAASVLAQRIDDLANRLLTTPLSEPIVFNGGAGRTTFYGGGWGTRELRQMPEGTSLTFYSPNGALIDSFLADSIVADRVMHAGRGGYLDLTGDLSFLPTTTIKPGQFFEDRILLNPRKHPLWGSVEIPPLAQNGRFTLEPRTRVSDLVEPQMPHVVKGTLVTVDQPMRLSDLLKPGMGDCHWAACSTRPGMPDSGTLWSVGGVMTLDAKDTSYLVRHSRQTAGEATNKTPAAVPLEIETTLSPEELRLNAAEPVLPPVVVFGANGDLGKTAVTTFTSQGVPTIAYVRRNPDGTTRPYEFPFEVRGTSIQGLVNADTPNLIVVHDLDRIPSGARVFAPLKSQSFIDAFKGNTMSDAASKRHIYVIANGTREIEGDLARTYPGVIYDRVISDVAASTSNNGTLLVTNSKPLHVQASEANRVLTSIFGEQPFMVLNQTTDMNSVVGQKLVLNTSANGPAVMLQSTVGELVAAHPEFMRAIIGEGYRVVTASGGRWPAASLKPLDAFTDNYINLFTTTYSPHPTSMGIDFAKGNALENHYINHGMSRLGREVGVPTPLNDLVARWVDKFEATRRNYPKDADVRGPGLLLFREREQAMIQQAAAEMRQLVERLR
jgi:ketopantoate reductase